MKSLKALLIMLAVIMFCAIVYGFIFSSFSDDGRAIMTITWGVISLIDIYIMFTLFSLWILFREGINKKSVALVIIVMSFGSLSATLYTLYALAQSKGSWENFWMGNKKVLTK